MYLKSILPTIIQKNNAFLKQQLEEKKLALLFDLPVEVQSVQLLDIELSVHLGDYYGGDDVFIFSQKFEITLLDNQSFIQTIHSFECEDLEEGIMVPENESEFVYVDSDGSKYACLKDNSGRERTEEEKVTLLVLRELDYIGNFNNCNFSSNMVAAFKKDKTKELNDSALKFFPFVTTFVHDGGSNIFMKFINGSGFYVRNRTFEYQLKLAKENYDEKQ